MSHLRKIFLLMIGGSFILSGCASTPKITKQTVIQDAGAPEWVLKGCAAFSGDRGKVFCGVGVAEGNQPVPTMRSKSDTRARDDLAKMIQIYNSSLTKDYVALTKEGKIKGVPEGHFEQVIKQVTTMTLTGVAIVDHWQHRATGELYALARVDFDAYKENFERMEQLNEKVRDYIRKNADRLHQELDKEVEKKK
tara:strand:- start:6897 stop:7478 length:582 start_codon:yes stop_codon:yes gene_type:complete